MSRDKTTGLSMVAILALTTQVVVISVFHAVGNAREQIEIECADITRYGPQGSNSIRFSHDPKPEPDVPREARLTLAYNTRDAKNYGPLRNVIGSITDIRIRYFDSEAFDRASVDKFLRAVIESENGDTGTHIPWAEALGVPAIEAYLYSESLNNPGYLLVWPGPMEYRDPVMRPGRAAYRDPKGKWWFTALPYIGGVRKMHIYPS